MLGPRTALTFHDNNGLQRVGPASQLSNPTDQLNQPTGPKVLNLGRAFLHRGRFMLMVVVLLNIVAFFGVRNLTPRYTASADVIVGPREEQVVDLKAVISGLSGSSDVIESEIQVLRSREIVRSVVQRFNLDQMVEFNPNLSPPGFKDRLAEFGSDVLAWVKGQSGALASQLDARKTEPHASGLKASAVDQASRAFAWLISLPGSFGGKGNAPAPDIAAIPGDPDLSAPVDPLSVPVDRFLNQLDVASKGRSRVITISFTSTNAVLAAKVANAVADAYIANQLKAKTDATSQAHQWLDDRVAELHEQLLAADEAVEDYRRRAGIFQIRDSTLLAQQLSEASLELMHAHEHVVDVSGRIKAQTAFNTAGLADGPLALNRELAVAKANEQSLEANLAKLRKMSDASSQSEIGLRALQREADADRNLYDRLLARARETKVQSGLQQADATIISRAERPGEPSFPKTGVLLPLFFVASCIVAGLLVIWRESLDRGFSSVSQLQNTLGVPAIGSVPLIKRKFGRWTQIGSYSVDHPRSSFAEAIRTLHTSLMLSGKDTNPKTILLASALPGEGKSSLALAIAHMMANVGKRVIIIDCDLRKPTIHKNFSATRAPGLTECLKGEAALNVVIQKDDESSIFFIAAGGDAQTSPDLFGSDAMRALLKELSAVYDLVLLDGAPVLGVSDTRHLSRIVDRTVFVVRWQSTRCAAVELGLRLLLDANATIAGTLLTMIDPKFYEKSSPIGIYRRRLALYVN